MTRRINDAAFRQGQLRDLYAPSVKPINKLVDELRVPGERWLPHVAPLHGGVLARLLLLGSDPGRQPPQDLHGSLLSTEDDNAGAARLSALLRRAGIDVAETCVWNACPWFVDHEPTAADLKAGLEPLRRVLELLDQLVAVVLLGRAAERSWRMLASTHPDEVPFAEVLPTREADDATFVGTNAQRHQWRVEQADVFLEARRLLDGGFVSPARGPAD